MSAQIRSFHHLKLDADRALFEGHLQGMVLSCHENERPLQGLAGLLDWRFQGALSHGLRAGVLTGRPGECAYVPVSGAGKAYHLILVGCGQLESPRKRGGIPSESLKTLERNLRALKLEKLGLSLSDFGGENGAMIEATIERELKGVPLWIVP